ncbi:MAG: tetratricopeptide repeat protein [Myxococcota bacterium]|nr:tetratricopeptide repeat protein [Myxococcota bacterium]
MTKGVVLAVLVLVTATTRDAHAQRAEADAAFERGRTLMQAGKYEEACEAFEASLRLEATIGTVYNLGLCHDKIGKLASAYTEFKQVAERDANKARAADSAKRVAALEPRLTKFRLVIKEPTAGLVVERDGVDITAFADQVVPVDPRRYTFVASAPGLEPYTAAVDLTKEGATIDVAIPALSTTKSTPIPDQPGVPAEKYPRALALRPFSMPDGMYEVGAATRGATSDTMFEQAPIDSFVAARIGIQMFEMGLRASFHTRYAEVDATRPTLWRSVAATFAYSINPMFVGRLEYTRYHPSGDLQKGSDLQVALLRKYLVAPRVAIAGSAGFTFFERGERSELVLQSTFGPQLTATPAVSVEVMAELGIAAGGELYAHTIDLGVSASGFYAVTRDLDVFARVFAGLLPAVEGSSSNDFRSVTIGVNWRP